MTMRNEDIRNRPSKKNRPWTDHDFKRAKWLGRTWEDFHSLVIPMNPSREPDTAEVKKIVLSIWRDKPFIESRYVHADFAIDEDKELNIKALIVRIPKWAGEL